MSSTIALPLAAASLAATLTVLEGQTSPLTVFWVILLPRSLYFCCAGF
jgi:hypothetical protein